jgi:membrane protein implicated in regulation of membrane protease activity
VDHGGVDLGHGDAGADVGHGDLGGDVDVDHGGELGHEVSEMSSSVVGILSPSIWATFMAMAGASGLIAENTGIGGPWSLVVALAAGTALSAVALFGLNTLARNVQGSSHIRLADTTNLEGQVITTIPAEGTGEVAYSARGSRRGGPARSADGKEIPRGTQVIIVKHEGGFFYVRPTVDERLRLLGGTETAEVTTGEDDLSEQPDEPGKERQTE